MASIFEGHNDGYTNWKKFKKYRFDMWAGGDAASRHQPEKSPLLHCESTWTRGNTVKDPDNPTITLDPPSDLPVTTTPSGACRRRRAGGA